MAKAQIPQNDSELQEVCSILSDEAVKRVHGGADFGYMTPRDVVNEGVVKVHLGYHCGSTQQAILIEHGLAWSRLWESPKKLKPKGHRYLKALAASGTVSGIDSAYLKSPATKEQSNG